MTTRSVLPSCRPVRGLVVALVVVLGACTYSGEYAPYSGPAEDGVPVDWSISTECGLDNSVFDLDGSLWTPTDLDPADIEGAPVGVASDNDEGTLTLISDDRAEYRSSQGRVLNLARLEGNLVVNDC